MRTVARLVNWFTGLPSPEWDLVGAFPIGIFLEWRRNDPPAGLRLGQMATCPTSHCRRTFIRTERDPQARQLCQVCQHDKTEHESRPTRPHLVS